MSTPTYVLGVSAMAMSTLFIMLIITIPATFRKTFSKDDKFVPLVTISQMISRKPCIGNKSEALLNREACDVPGSRKNKILFAPAVCGVIATILIGLSWIAWNSCVIHFFPKTSWTRAITVIGILVGIMMVLIGIIPIDMYVAHGIIMVIMSLLQISWFVCIASTGEPLQFTSVNNVGVRIVCAVVAAIIISMLIAFAANPKGKIGIFIEWVSFLLISAALFIIGFSIMMS